MKVIQPQGSKRDEKNTFLDDEALSSQPQKHQKLSAVTDIAFVIASVANWVACATGVSSVTLKDGGEVPVNVIEDTEAQRNGMNKELQSMKPFDVYTEKPLEQCTESEIDSAIGLKWVRRWKSDDELRMRLVAQGCY